MFKCPAITLSSQSLLVSPNGPSVPARLTSLPSFPPALSLPHPPPTHTHTPPPTHPCIYSLSPIDRISAWSFIQASSSSVTQSCLTLCNPMDYSMPGFPVYPQLPELAQTHVHRVGDAIQSSHPLSSPPPPAFNLSQHQSLFQ